MARLQILDTQAAIDAGHNDATNLITELCNLDGTTSPAQLFMESLSEIIGLAIECRSAEASARLSGYAEVIAPMLEESCNWTPPDDTDALRDRIAALEAKCTMYGASLTRADKELIEINRQKAAAQDVVDTAVLLAHAIEQGRIKLVGTDGLAEAVTAQLARETLALEPREGSK